jgi:hypothetical protein
MFLTHEEEEKKVSPAQQSGFIMLGTCTMRNHVQPPPDSMIRMSDMWGNPGYRQFSSFARLPDRDLKEQTKKGVMLQKSE